MRRFERLPAARGTTLLYYPIYETSGSSIANYGTSGSATLTVAGAASLGRAGLFNGRFISGGGQNDVAQGAGSVKPTTTTMGIAAWIYPRQNSLAYIVMKPWGATWTSPWTSGLALVVSSSNAGDVQAITTISGSNSVATASAGGCVIANAWNLVGVDMTGSLAVGYCNGGQVSSGSKSGTLDFGSNSVGWILGGNNVTASQGFNGFIAAAWVDTAAFGADWHEATWRAGMGYL